MNRWPSNKVNNNDLKISCVLLSLKLRRILNKQCAEVPDAYQNF